MIAGELSGDAHGAGLLRALPDFLGDTRLEIRGAGGPAMREIAGEGLRDWVEDAAVMGVWEVLKRYGWFRARFEEMLRECREFQPHTLLLIDYPGFNLRFAEALRRELPDTKLVYYISPQVWAWHKGRVPKMAKLLDEMLCLFPFEEPIFSQAGLKTTFVGHPLIDELEEERMADAVRNPQLVGLFPGSREREVARLMPMMLGTAGTLLQWRPDLRFEVPAASPKLAHTIRAMVADSGPLAAAVTVTDGGSHSLMQRAACGVIASGTATLEAACYGLPYCLVYGVAWPTYLLGRMLVKIQHIGLVNILAGEEVVREFIQADAEPIGVSRCLREWLENPEKATALQLRLAETAAMLGGPGAHARAAEAVARWLLAGSTPAVAKPQA